MTIITKNPTKTQYAKKPAQVAADFARSQLIPSSKNAGLGKDASIVAAFDAGKYQAFRTLAFAQSLLIKYHVTNTNDAPHRTRFCHAVRAYQAETITLRLSTDADNSKASLAGVQTCGSVWSCPVCSRRIAVERAKEIGMALDWADQNKHTPIMLTLTARHDAGMSLDYIQTRFRAAWRKMSQTRAYRRIKDTLNIKHSIKATEITRGDKGWHYHSHGLLFVPNQAIYDASEDDLATWKNDLDVLWLHCLAKVGLSGKKGIASNVQFHGNVRQQYLSKLGLDSSDKSNAQYELSSGINKTKGGRNIWQILRNAKAGNESDEKLYAEYVISMQGVNWITWSHGLKDIVGVADIKDVDLSTEDKAVRFEDFLNIPDHKYAAVRRLRLFAELLAITSETRDVETVCTWIDAQVAVVAAATQSEDLDRWKEAYMDTVHGIALDDDRYRKWQPTPGQIQRYKAKVERLTWISGKIAEYGVQPC